MKSKKYFYVFVHAMLTLVLIAGLSGSAGAAYTNPPNTVNFTFNGCDNDGTIFLPNADGNFVCPDPEPLGGNDTRYQTGKPR